MKLTIIAGALLLSVTGLANAARTDFQPGVSWSDTKGTHINAHGGGIAYHNGTYYWFGEDRTGSTSNGISCYTSTDLYNWTRKGLVFKASQALDPETKKCILERPKVIFNPVTNRWIMYIHWENGLGYGEARVCVASCDKVDGDYEFHSTFRPNGHDSRDQTIFRDTDGKAYHFGSTDMNTNMNVALLSEDMLTTEQNPVTDTKILNGLRYEAPAIFKVGDIYFGLFSGCTGWDPNPGHTATATDILDWWEPGQNFCVDNGAATSYRSQSTFVLKVEGKEGAYIYMGDRWNSSDVGGKSEYVWLPLSVRSGAPTVKWYDKWDLSVFDDATRWSRISKPAEGAEVRILDKYSDRWFSTKGNGFFIGDDNDTQNINWIMEATANPYIWKFKEKESGNYLHSVFGALILKDDGEANTALWRLELNEDGTYGLQSVNDKKYLSVSGAAQTAGTSLFMAAGGSVSSQCFGLYFDTREHGDYEPADMFSAAYRDKNLKEIAEQKEFEKNAGVELTVTDTDVKPEYFDLQGNRLQTEPQDAGIYIVRTGSTVKKIIR